MKIVFAGGGTGGHIFPILAVKRELKRQSVNVLDFEYIGPKDIFSFNYLNKEGIRTKFVKTGKMRRYFNRVSFFQNMTDFLINIPIGVLQSFVILFFDAPDLVFSKGGFGSIPVVIAARLLSIPVLLHESDITPGVANRIASSFCSRIYVSFPEKDTEYFPLNKMVSVGNPIREDLLTGSSEEAKKLFNLKYEKPTILILGGSQGSERINQLIIRIAPEMLKDFEVIHQTGQRDFRRVRDEVNAILPNDLKTNYHVYDFFDETYMKHALAAADCIVARSGSGTIFEISAVGKPSILIPLPEAAQNHQTKNAYAYARTGASTVIEEKNLTPHFFLETLRNMFQFKDVWKIRESAKNFSKPESAKIIASDILKILD